METGFAVTAFLSVILNLALPEEIEDEETPELTADVADEAGDREEWDRIRRPSQMPRKSSDETGDMVHAKGAAPVAESEKKDTTV
jgi:hypothetical protein